MSPLSILAIILAVWGVITLVRRIAEAEQRTDTRTGGRADTRTDGRTDARTGGRGDDDEIDYDELRRAEEEVRGLGSEARPEDGFEGDDWGPGARAPKKPPYY